MLELEKHIIYIIQVGVVTFVQLFLLSGLMLILILLLSELSGYVRYLAITTIGLYTYHWLFGLLGTALHEFSHLLVSLLFRHKIKSFRIVNLNLTERLRGSYEPELNYGSLYQVIGLFFVGIAPILVGISVIFLMLYALFPNEVYRTWRNISVNNVASGSTIGSALSSGISFLSIVFSPKNFLDWRLYAFLYIAFMVGSSIHLSSSDIKGSAYGCLPVIVLLFLFNTVLLSVGVTTVNTFEWLTQYYIFLYVILSFVILLDLLVIAILWVPAKIQE
jgi:hypothetical protein